MAPSRARGIQPPRWRWVRVRRVLVAQIRRGVPGGLRRANDQRAEQALAKLRENPDSRDRHRAAVRALSRAGRLQEAERLARQWLERDPKDPEALTYLSDAVGRLGRRAEAIRLLTGIVDLAPEEEKLHERLARAFERAGWQEASCAERLWLASEEPEAAPTAGEARHAVVSKEVERLARARQCVEAAGYGHLKASIGLPQGWAPRWTAGRSERDEERRLRRAQLRLEASWQVEGGVPLDLDLSIVTPQGTRVSWLGGRRSVVGEAATTPGVERLGLRRLPRGTYRIEIGTVGFVQDQRPPGNGPPPALAQAAGRRVRGTVTVVARGRRRTVPFEFVVPSTDAPAVREEIASVEARWTMVPVEVRRQRPGQPAVR